MSSSTTLNDITKIFITARVPESEQPIIRYKIEQCIYKLAEIDIVGKICVRRVEDNLFIRLTKVESRKDCTVAEIDLLQNLMLDMFDENIKLIYNKMIDGLGDYLFKQSFNMLFDLETFYSARSSYFAHLCTIYKNKTTTS